MGERVRKEIAQDLRQYGEPVARRAVFNNPGRGSSAGGGYSTVGDLLNLDRAFRSGKLLGPEWASGAVTRADRPGTPAAGGAAKLTRGFGFAG